MSDPEQNNVPLNYAPPAVEGARKSLYPLILWLGATPLVVGVAITILYHFTEWMPLTTAGIVTIFGGLVCVVAGAIFLLAYWAQELRARPPSRWAVHFRVALAGMLLLSNFPAALLCMSIALEKQTRLRITIVNRGTTSVSQCALVTATQTRVVGPLAPGQSITCSLRNPDRGSLTLKRSNSTGTVIVTVCDYVDSDVTGPWTITINGDDTSVR